MGKSVFVERKRFRSAYNFLWRKLNPNLLSVNPRDMFKEIEEY